ncbi:helix-turn-helix domain-containing protein [Lacticaseibacillus sharpeae]|nr:helix-turn-helix domain-containing protein [Lacticaseibacillus sharpeae]
MAKQQGFMNEYLYVLPADILRNFASSPIIKQLYITDLGFYPQAQDHYVHRKQGTAEWILIFCTHGAGTVESMGTVAAVTRGSMVLLPPNQEHTYYADKDDPWDIFWVHFTGTRLAEYLPALVADNPKMVVQTRTNPQDVNLLMSQFQQMLAALAAGFSYNAVFYAAQTLGMTLAYLRLHEEKTQAPTMGNNIINQAVQYIYDHMDVKVSLADVSREINVSASYLSRIFGRTVGLSVNQFILQVKVQQATHYLVDTTLPVQQIARNLGFADQYYFSRAFKKIMAVAPLQYRKHANGGSKKAPTVSSQGHPMR